MEKMLFTLNITLFMTIMPPRPIPQSLCPWQKAGNKRMLKNEIQQM